MRICAPKCIHVSNAKSSRPFVINQAETYQPLNLDIPKGASNMILEKLWIIFFLFFLSKESQTQASNMML